MKSNKYTEAAPRLFEVILGVISAFLSIIFAVVTAAPLILVVQGEWSDNDATIWLVMTVLSAALTFFFSSVAWRTLSGRPRRHGGGLLPPSLILASGVFFVGTTVWFGVEDVIDAWEVGVIETLKRLYDVWEFLALSVAMLAWGIFRIRNRVQVCRNCGHPYEHQSRSCDECGYEVTPKEEFYPALWSYGCPRYEDCREVMTFADDELRCPVHGGIYRIGEQDRGIPSKKIFNVGTHRLDHIRGVVDEDVGNYSIMACPGCNPRGYYCDPNLPGGNPAFSMYMRNDKEGATLTASCRACGLDHDEYVRSLAVDAEEYLDSA